jgi:hypothetical protein
MVPYFDAGKDLHASNDSAICTSLMAEGSQIEATVTYTPYEG